MHGPHCAGGQAGDPGGGPLPAGACHHVQESCQVSCVGGCGLLMGGVSYQVEYGLY